MNNKKLGRIIQKMREDADLSQNELARRSQLSPSFVTKLEKGEYKSLTLISSKALASGLGLCLKDFLIAIGFLDKENDSTPADQIIAQAFRKKGCTTKQTEDILKYAKYVTG